MNTKKTGIINIDNNKNQYQGNTSLLEANLYFKPNNNEKILVCLGKELLSEKTTIKCMIENFIYNIIGGNFIEKNKNSLKEKICGLSSKIYKVSDGNREYVGIHTCNNVIDKERQYTISQPDEEIFNIIDDIEKTKELDSPSISIIFSLKNINSEVYKEIEIHGLYRSKKSLFLLLNNVLYRDLKKIEKFLLE